MIKYILMQKTLDNVLSTKNSQYRKTLNKRLAQNIIKINFKSFSGQS